MKSSYQFILFTLMISTSTWVTAESKHDQCLKDFNSKNYQRVITKCSDNINDFPKIQFLVLASKLFNEISDQKIHDIFLDERLGGQLKRMNDRDYQWLYSDHDEVVLKKYKHTFDQLAEQNVPDALFWSAILHYIDEYSFAKHDGRWKDKVFKKGLDQRKDHFYTMRLETYHLYIPNNPQVNFLLGLEGLKVHIPNRRVLFANPEKFKAFYLNDSKTLFYSIEEPRYYEYMLSAAAMGFEPAQIYIDGVNGWDEYQKILYEKAKKNDLNALFELGGIAFSDGRVEEAIKHYTKAGEAGDIQSLNELKRFYSRQSSNLDDYVMTIRKLVEYGDTDAMLNLGNYHLCKGQNKKASALYQKAESKGNVLAKYSVIDMDDYGEPASGCDFYK